MEMNKFLLIVKNKKQTVFTFVLLCFVFAGILTVVQPFMYKTESKILVYQENIDPYAMTKSGQYLSSLLTSVITTSSFYEEVVNSGYNINVFYFSSNKSERMKIWENTVEPIVVDDSGVFRVDVYHPDRYQSKQIAQAINYVLKTKHKAYHGAGGNVTIKIIDTPISSNFPVRPRFILNLFIGVMSGVVLSFLYIYLFPESRYDIRIFPKKKIRKKKNEEKQDIDNTRKIKRDVQRVLNAQLEFNKNESMRHGDDFQPDKQRSKAQNKTEFTFDEDDIEREGSMSNVIGFSNLGN